MTVTDPIHLSGPDKQRELFNKLVAEASGWPVEDVVSVALNLVVNAIRQKTATAMQAEATWDEVTGRAKTVLLSHYDMLGRKRGIFPFDQVIHMQTADLRERKDK